MSSCCSSKVHISLPQKEKASEIKVSCLAVKPRNCAIVAMGPARQARKGAQLGRNLPGWGVGGLERSQVLFVILLFRKLVKMWMYVLCVCSVIASGRRANNRHRERSLEAMS